MIINAKASSTVDFGKYLTDRDAAAFTIIEGDPERADSLATALLEGNKKRKNTHYSFVLSFKEEDLTRDELFDYYMQFKEMMFKNYNPDELEILSVIHWDDEKPHIHCVVLNASQLDNSRDLRLYRGYVDFKRVEAVQEKINYENGLSSPFNNYNLLSLTEEQKRRDWLVKKGRPHYEVLDDLFFRAVEQSIKKAKDFGSFISSLEAEVGKTLIHISSKYKKNEFGKEKLLGEHALVLEDKVLPTGQNYVYNSRLFDKKWFEKNLGKLQDSLSRTQLKNIKFSAQRGAPADYNRLFAETTKKHAEHLLSRRVGSEYITKNRDKILDENLSLFKNGSLSGVPKNATESIVEKFLINCGREQLKEFSRSFPYPYEIQDDFVRYKKNEDSFFDVYNQDLLIVLKDGSVSSRNTSKAPVSEKIKLEDFKPLLENLRSNKNKARLRALLLLLIEQEKIKNLKELKSLLEKLGLNILKKASDARRGQYVTLESGGQKASVYDSFFFHLASDRVFPEETVYKTKRDDALGVEELSGKANTYLKNVYDDLVKEHGSVAVNCVNDYRLISSPYLGAVIEENGFVFTKDYIEYAKHSKKTYEKVADSKEGSLCVEKSLDPSQTGKNIADFYSLRGVKDLYIDNRSFDPEVKKGIISRAKEMSYALWLWDTNPSYINGNSLLFSNRGDGGDDAKRAEAKAIVHDHEKASVSSGNSLEEGKQDKKLSHGKEEHLDKIGEEKEKEEPHTRTDLDV